MIFGNYPCCDGPFSEPVPDNVRLPVYFREECPHCGAPVWHKISRADPMSWTEENFLIDHDIDDTTKKITEKRDTSNR